MKRADVERNVKRGMAVGLCALTVLGLHWYWHVPPDLYGIFFPVAQRWLAGGTLLYDAAADGYYHTPWLLGLILPFAFFPFAVTQIVWQMLTLLAVLATVGMLWDRAHFSSAIMAVAALPVLFCLNNGSADGFVVLGLGLMYLAVRRERPLWLSAALVILGFKPLNVILPVLVALWAVRRWHGRSWLQIVALPTVTALVSCFFAGPDWIPRFIVFSARGSPVFSKSYYVTIWRASEALNLPSALTIGLAVVTLAGLAWVVKREGLTRFTFALAITVNLVFTPYAMEQHYVLLIPAFLLVAQNAVWRWVSYCSMLVVLVRLSRGWEMSWLMILYPLCLLVGLWAWHMRGEDANRSRALPVSTRSESVGNLS